MSTSTDLSQLELKIATLLTSLEQLKNENHSLRKKIAKMAQDRSRLEDKTQTASKKIRQIINLLREELT